MIRNICCRIDFPASFQDLKHERAVTPGLKPGAEFLSSLRDWNMIRNICCGIDFPASFQDLKHERTVTPGLKPGAEFLSSLRDWNGLSGFLRRIIYIM